MVEPSPSENEYLGIFVNYIVGGVKQTLSHVRSVDTQIGEADRLQAWHILSYALQITEAWPYTRELLLTLAPLMTLAGFREDWMTYLLQGLTQSQIQHDDAASAALYLEIGEMQRHLGRLSDAWMSMQQALVLSEQVSDRRYEAIALNRLANVAFLQRRFTEAVQLTAKALDVAGDNDPERAFSLYVRANVAFDQHLLAEAHITYREALTIWEQTGDRRAISLCVQNLGRIAYMEQRYEDAIAAYNQAIQTLDEIGDYQSRAIVQTNLGVIHYLLDHLDVALVLFYQAELVLKSLHDVRYLAIVYNNMGLVYHEQSRLDDAESAYKQSVRYWQQLGDIKSRVNSEDSLGEVYSAKGDGQRAVELFDRLLVELQNTERDAEYDRLCSEVTIHRKEALEL